MSVITISRHFGAAGKTLGKRIADTLGYYYADEDIIDRAAVEMYASPDWKRIVDEEPADRLKEYISRLNPFEKSLMERPLSDNGSYIDGSHYVELLKQIITKIGTDGNAVIVGRGGQYILNDFDDTYHLLLIAKEKDRIELVENNYRVSKKNAIQMVKRMAKRRANLYGYFDRKDYDDPDLYDIVLNMSLLNTAKAEEIVYKLITN